MTHLDRRLMRWTNGRLSSGVGTTFQHQLLLLTSTGAKSGKPRDTPLVFAEAGDEIVLVASRGGSERNPAWYHNLKAHSRCEVRLRGTRRECTAREVLAEERERYWSIAEGVYSGFKDYAARSPRTIPVMVLSNRAS